MPRRDHDHHHDSDSDDPLDGGPDDADADLIDHAGELDDTARCPACDASIWHEAQRCPSCGAWLTAADRAGRDPFGGGALTGRIWTWVVVAIIVLLVVLLKTH